MRGYNDDLVMALAIACWVRDTALQVNERDVEYKKAILNSMYLNKTTMNTSIKGMNGYGSDIKEKQLEAKRQMDDFVWIFKG